MADTTTPAPGQKWQHCRGGLYEVIALGQDAASGTLTVVYKSHEGHVWCRPLWDWETLVKDAIHPRGVPRFTRVIDAAPAPVA